MAQNPPEGFPQITPYLLYEDLDGAVDWLVATFAFTERVRMKGPDGKANHAELAPHLQVWFRADSLHLADGERVHVWPDQSGHGRDLSVTYRVWSPRAGYPGHAEYRDFHTFDHASGFRPARSAACSREASR